MAGITLAQAQAKLDMWLEAEEALSTSQSYSFGGRQLTRANLSDIEAAIDKWDARVKKLSRDSGPRIRGGTPI